jgi:hypothetical protein
LLAGDGIKICKEAEKMPGVKTPDRSVFLSFLDRRLAAYRKANCM